METRPTNLRIPPEIKQRLREHAEREDRTLTAVVLRACRQYLDAADRREKRERRAA